jgi:predicted N-acetyltransferase YhbS
MTVIRPLEERDVPKAQRIIRIAFGTFLGAPEPETFWSDLDYARGRFGAEHVEAFAAEDEGQLVGSNFATRWGSVGFFGPITIRPDIWDGGIGQRLVGEACDAFDRWGVSHAGLFTFPQSTKHVWTYGKFGFHPRYLTPVMAMPTRQGSTQHWLRYSELPAGQRIEVVESVRALTERLYPGLDLGAEIRTAFARGLGDTLMLTEGDSHVAAFAVCHVGLATEAGAGNLFIKFGAAMPGPGAEQRFANLLDACIDFGARVGMTTVVAGVNTAREAAYRAMQQRGFRTQFQGVTMHRPNEPGYSRPELFVLDDWR